MRYASTTATAIPSSLPDEKLQIPQRGLIAPHAIIDAHQQRRAPMRDSPSTIQPMQAANEASAATCSPGSSFNTAPAPSRDPANKSPPPAGLVPAPARTAVAPPRKGIHAQTAPPALATRPPRAPAPTARLLAAAHSSQSPPARATPAPRHSWPQHELPPSRSPRPQPRGRTGHKAPGPDSTPRLYVHVRANVRGQPRCEHAHARGR